MILREKNFFKKHDFEKEKISKKHDFECEIFSIKHAFEWENFCKEHVFELKLLRFVSFRIKNFTTCEFWKQTFYNMSDFKSTY